MATYTPSVDVKKWYPDKSDITKWVYDIIKYLHDTPIPTEEVVAKAVDDYLRDNPITGVYYSPTNPPPYPVTSVNGQTGAVNVDTSKLYSPTNPPPYPVTSVNGQTGDVTVDVDTSNLYGPSNPPPYPVTSVNGQTGAVSVSGFTVNTAKNITISNNNTDNVTLTMDNYITGKYKAIFVIYECLSSNKDTGIFLKTTNNDFIAGGISDYDEAQYSFKFAGVAFYPTLLDDTGVLKLTATNADAQLYCSSMYWWGVS